MSAEPQTRMDEFDKIEWFDVVRKLKPGLTQEEYDQMWDDYLKAKSEHTRQKGLQ